MARQATLRPEMDWSMDAELPQRFKVWKRQVTSELRLQMAEDPNKQQLWACTYIIVCAGEQGENVIQQAKLLEEKEDHTKILDALEEFVSPSNHFVEDSFNYFYLKQGDMSVSHYQAAAEQLIMIPQYDASRTMKHSDVKQLLLRNLLLVGLRHKDVLKQCQTMKNDACTAEHLLNLARQAEYRDTTALRLTKTVTSNAHAHTLQDNSESSLHQSNQRRQKTDQQKNTSSSRRPTQCRWCGGSRLCRRHECPARDSYCNKCHIKGHFEKVCRQDSTRRINKRQPLHKLDDDEDEEGEDDDVTSVYSFKTMYNLNVMESEHIRPLWISTTATSQVHKVSVEVDTGAACNVMPVYLFSKIFGNKQPESSNARIQAYGGMPVTIVGKCTVFIHNPDGKQTSAVFQVTHHNGHAIIGRSTSRDIGYVNFPAIDCPPLSMTPITHAVQTLQQHVEKPIVTHKTQSSITIDNITHKLPISKDYVLNTFKDVFDGIGTLPGGDYHLRLKPDAKPVQHAPRQVPEKKKAAYKAELERLTHEGIIKKEDGHTPWINSIVPAVKPDGSIRLCLDPKDLNRSLERNAYYMKTIEELSAELRGCNVFTAMDAKQGYWHVPLDKYSSLLTTFNTPWGKYRFTRLPFRLKVSGDVSQERLDNVLCAVPNVTNIVDDCLVKATNETEHDTNLLTLLHVARANGIKFNSKKLQFKQKRVKFFGQNISADGIGINETTVEAIETMKAPKDKATLQSFLGLVNYMKKFSQNLSQFSHPLRELVKQHTIFQWESHHDDAFKAVKDELSRTPTLQFFDPSKNHIIQTDASLKGLGAVLIQEERPVMYASRSLLPAEERYSNIERELLGVVFGLERMHNMIFGGPVKVQTDQQPLVNIFNKQICDVSPRLQRLLLRAQKYEVRVTYIKGTNNSVADALSRVSPLPPRPTDVRPDDVTPLHVLSDSIPANQSCLDSVKTETQKDGTLQQLALYVHHGWPGQKTDCDPSTFPYWLSREEITLEDGILFRGIQMIIPETLRRKFLGLLHKGHLGEEENLLLARTTIYWPNYTDDIRQTVWNCQACQSTRCSQQQEGLSQYEVPAGPWKRLGIDYFEWNQQRYLLIADYYSRFPILRSVSTMSAAHLVTVLKTIFSEYGLPEELVSDQGTQFTSEQYTSFAKEYNIKITHSSPRYPQSNGFIESMVKITKQILERCKQTSSDPHIAMLLYRATPLQSGMASPAELLSQRRYRTTLPIKNREPVRSRNHRETMAKSRDKREEYFNKKATDYRQLQMHEPVYVQLNPDKATWQKANVIGTPIENNPRSYKIQLPTGQRFTRNRRHLRPDRGTTPDDNELDQMADREPRGPRRSARENHAPRRLRYNQLGQPSY